MSFWIDWWLLLVVGIGIVIMKRILPKIGIKLSSDSLLSQYMFGIVLLSFYIINVSLFCGFTSDGVNPFGFLGVFSDWIFETIKNTNADYYTLYPEANSTEYIFSSAKFWLKDAGAAPFNNLEGLAQHPYHLFIGILIFCTYPFLLHLGIRLGELLFGSKQGKKGVLHLL